MLKKIWQSEMKQARKERLTFAVAGWLATTQLQ